MGEGVCVIVRRVGVDFMSSGLWRVCFQRTGKIAKVCSWFLKTSANGTLPEAPRSARNTAGEQTFTSAWQSRFLSRLRAAQQLPFTAAWKGMEMGIWWKRCVSVFRVQRSWRKQTGFLKRRDTLPEINNSWKGYLLKFLFIVLLYWAAPWHVVGCE